jgi:hypothetical protein
MTSGRANHHQKGSAMNTQQSTAPKFTQPEWATDSTEILGSVIWSRPLHEDDMLGVELRQFVDVNATDDAYLQLRIGDSLVDVSDGAKFSPARIEQLARDLLTAAQQAHAALVGGENVGRWPFVEPVTRVWRYHRVEDGVDQGVFTIAVQKDRADWLAAMKPGETIEHVYQLGKGFPKVHLVDTFVGEFELVTKLADGTAIVRPVDAEGA